MAKYKLAELFELQMGKTPSRDKPEYWSQSEFSWISIADLTSAGKYIYETKESLSKLAIEESGIKVIPSNTVVMSFKLSIGKVSITPHPMYSNEAIMAFIDKGVTRIKPEYLYYLLLYRNWDEGTNKAVMGNTLNKATLSDVVIDIHPIEEQEMIVLLLDKVMEIISDFNCQIRAFNILIKARFVEMFGDPETNPMDWPVEPLGALLCVEPQNGLYKPQSDYVQDGTGIPILRIDAFYDGKVNDFSRLKRLTCTESEKQRYLLMENDIVINRVNSIEYLGKCAWITGMIEPTVFESNMMRFHVDEKRIDPCYLTRLLCSTFIYNQILTRAKKAVNQASINQGDVQSFAIVVPPLGLQKEYASFVYQVDKSKAVVQEALDKAQLLFDSLMQQYFG